MHKQNRLNKQTLLDYNQQQIIPDCFQKTLIDREHTRPMQPDNLTHHTIIAEGVEPYKTTFLQLHSFRFGFSRISDLSS